MSDKIRKFHLTPEQNEEIVKVLAKQTGWADRLVRGHRTGAQMVAMLRDTIRGNYCVYDLSYGVLREIHHIHHIRGRSIAGDYPRHCISLCVECHDRVTRNMGNPDNFELQAIVDSMSVDYPTLLKLDYNSHVEDIQVYIDEYINWIRPTQVSIHSVRPPNLSSL